MIPLQNAIKKFRIDTIPAEATALDALRKMAASDFAPLLVPRKGRNDAYGIVTRGDLLKKVFAAGRDAKQVRVSEIMSKPLITVNDLTMDLRWAARLMTRCGVSALAVLDRGEFYGFITDACIIEEYFNEMRREKVHRTGEMLSC
ncbi:MAG: CBS domain-containing protein [Thermoplasmata archaeon]